MIDLNMFAALGLSSRLLTTLAAEGYETPTPIQAQCIPPALGGSDLLGCAQTGTGKTAAFSLPLIERLLASVEQKGRQGRGGQPRRTARALVLAPTRELAAQINESLRTYGRGTGMRAAVIYGGVKQYQQVRQLKAGVEVIVATPGRLLDLMDQGYVDLRAVEMLVLDEADRMLDMGFIDPIRKISAALPTKRQTLFFSATMPPNIRELADSMLRNPVSVSIKTVAATMPKIEQSLYHIAGEHKSALLKHLLENARVERGVVFTKTKRGADSLAEQLVRDGITSAAIHGNRSQSQRERTLGAFRAGKFRVLVATDVAARGLDVDGITDVFNFNLPMEPEAYVHRIGRTGRAGAVGRAVSFCSREERGLLRDIERVTNASIDPSPIPSELGIRAEVLDTSRKRRRSNKRGKPVSNGPRSGGSTSSSSSSSKYKKNKRVEHGSNGSKRQGQGSRRRQRSGTRSGSASA